VVAAVEVDGGGAVSRAGISFLGMGPTPIRARQAEQALVGSTPTASELDEIGRLAVADTDPTADVHASAEYRKHVGAHLVVRALDRALGAARG
jgi:carbon-monoxide dehydrogenase medium subunit